MLFAINLYLVYVDGIKSIGFSVTKNNDKF